MTHYIPATILLLSLLALPAQAVTKPAPKSEIAWKMVKVRHGRFQVPHLTRYRDPKVVKSVNRQIDAIIADLGCGPEKEGKDGLEIGTSVKLAARDIFSVYISGSYFCGLYPENDDKRSTTFDLRTGRPVEFEGLFKDYTRDRRAILSTIFAKQVAEAEKHPRPENPDPNDDGSCDKDPWLYALDDLEEGSYTFNFASNGLEVQPDWPHVVQACEERVTVPYEKLKPYAAPGGLLERMVPTPKR
jgi:hypothetical protein